MVRDELFGCQKGECNFQEAIRNISLGQRVLGCSVGGSGLPGPWLHINLAARFAVQYHSMKQDICCILLWMDIQLFCCVNVSAPDWLLTFRASAKIVARLF